MRTALILTSLFLAAPAAASAPQQVSRQVFSPGGRSVAGVLHLMDTIGEPIVGRSIAGGNALASGFLYAIHPYLVSPLTSVVFAGVQAQVAGTGVDVHWQIASADRLSAFRVYRAVSADGSDFVRIADLGPSAESFRDVSVRPGVRYTYRVGGVDRDGEFFSVAIRVVTPAWKTELRQNFPNPFNPSTTISLYLSAPGPARLAIFDATGAEVRRLADGWTDYGSHEWVWDGRDQAGRPVASGVYFCQLRAGNRTQTRKMVLVK